MDVMFQADVSCPYCGETIRAEAETTTGAQAFIEDCPVCCRPIEYRLKTDESGAWTLQASRDDEA